MTSDLAKGTSTLFSKQIGSRDLAFVYVGAICGRVASLSRVATPDWSDACGRGVAIGVVGCVHPAREYYGCAVCVMRDDPDVVEWFYGIASAIKRNSRTILR